MPPAGMPPPPCQYQCATSLTPVCAGPVLPVRGGRGAQRAGGGAAVPAGGGPGLPTRPALGRPVVGGGGLITRLSWVGRGASALGGGGGQCAGGVRGIPSPTSRNRSPPPNVAEVVAKRVHLLRTCSGGGGWQSAICLCLKFMFGKNPTCSLPAALSCPNPQPETCQGPKPRQLLLANLPVPRGK